ncbi:acyl-CoA dehydrogenase family protein [Archaeoglobus fulgidus]|uniref:Acyl-CoA dehydrogenase (Acd-2) n=3 Tax=Archaeoglobus fulgidus TaxID=2234 RepID=O29813_ARCFU|nr:acyl-CoA dehydrogenase family protein [Archaeoglobus fulgidus]AAB90797.1 acyl-CoA dehydrogenase (acd-2) [Archaeoglobus fulgidus DSM 4304]AIG97254.1 Acyl-CoA dehydrogenase [Archaeoglobus fulgidus DSM 8774]KUJ92585.1 MAG: Acyl-CoA dehydrogenase (Acd-2) [Archaeoglobus fulgidus]KUK05708.1 MAG: Acyl-CoA dehydrogenase (Acd-2) [Archaeoglobus fulgidus]
MDFKLTPEQEDIRRAAREFAEKEFTPEVIEECDREEKYPMEIVRKARDLGFSTVKIPEEYGGMGLSLFEEALVTEEFYRVSPGIGNACLSSTFGTELLILFGSEEQKEKYLRWVTERHGISAMATTEPEAGSDVANVKTKIVKEGDEWVINGTKMFITNGTVCDFVLVLGRTYEGEKRHHGLTFAIVESKSKGFKATKIKNKLGLRASDTAEIVLKDVKVPEENILGEPGKGFYYLMEFFNHTRPRVAAQAVGIAQGAFELALNYVKQRKQFGQPIAAFQHTQFKIAEMATRIQAARLLTWQAAWQCSIGQSRPELSSMAKWFAGETAVYVADWCVQLHGGYGYIGEYPAERYYRDAKLMEIYEGTKEVQKQIIARRLIGKL